MRRWVSLKEVWVDTDSVGKRPSATEGTAAREKAGRASAALMRAPHTGAGDFGELLPGFALRLDGAGEEGAVAAQRTVESGFGLVLPAVRMDVGFGLGIAGFDEGIGGEEVDVAVESIGAGEGDHVEIAAGAAAEFGSDVGGGDAELGHGLLADGDAAGAGSFVAVVQAVDGEAVVPSAHSGEGEAAIRRCAAHAGLGAQRVGTGSGGNAGREQDDAQVAAVLRGSLFEGFAADSGAGGGRGGIESFGLLAHVDGAAGTGELELKGLLQGLVESEVDLRDFGALKAGLFAADGVGTDGQGGNAVTAVGAGAGCADGAGGVERGGDGGIGDGGTRGIEDEALDGSLGEGRERKEHECHEATHE